MMKFARPVAVTAALSLTGLTPLLLAAPAEAAAPVTVVRKAAVNLQASTKVQVFGKNVALLAQVRTADKLGGRFPKLTNDRIRLQRRSANGPWRTLRTTAGTSDLWRIPASRSARYRVKYSGGTRVLPDGTREVWKPAHSRPVTVKVRRTITSRAFTVGERAGFRGRVSPKFRGLVTYQTQLPGQRTWRTVRRFRLTHGRTFSVMMDGRANQKFRVVVPSNAHQLGTSVSYKLSYAWGA